MTVQLVMCWSGGKDSVYALQRLLSDQHYQVCGLLTTITEPYGRISMHGVRTALLEAQAKALGLPLQQVPIPAGCSNDEYEMRMGGAFALARRKQITALGFGDLFLEDIRAYRERLCAQAGLTPIFPLWGEPTAPLARRIVGEGYRATLCAVDPTRLDGSYAGRAYSNDLIDDLPSDVDPCGENGEFHTFVHDGPGFAKAIPLLPGEKVEREGFVFADLIPAPPSAVPSGARPASASASGKTDR